MGFAGNDVFLHSVCAYSKPYIKALSPTHKKSFVWCHVRGNVLDVWREGVQETLGRGSGNIGHLQWDTNFLHISHKSAENVRYVLDVDPTKLIWNLTIPLGKGNVFANHPVLRSMLVCVCA